MIGLLDQTATPNPWTQRSPAPKASPPPTSGPGSKGLDAMDEEVEDEEVQIPLRDCDETPEPYKRYECPMDLDDDLIEYEGDDEHARVIRERKRTISMKLKETVEAFRRMNSSTQGPGRLPYSHGGSTTSSSGGELSYSPNSRNPKLSNKMSSTESGVESANGDGGCSRRESLSVYGAEAKREYMRPRRQTITSKWPPASRRTKLAPTTAAAVAAAAAAAVSGGAVAYPSPQLRKSSNDSQFVDDCEMDYDEEMVPPSGYKGRRFSVPEKVLREADFAIFRQKDRVLQCLRAFTRFDEPLKQFMQSVTCYDVAPPHSAVCVVDAGLTVRKAIIAYCSTGLAAALLINTTNDDSYDILTLTDCIHIFRIVAENPKKADIKLRDFYAEYMTNRKKIIYAPTTQTIWETAKLFRINRVHRIPVIHRDQGKMASEQPNLLYFISLRSIFNEVIFKLLETKYIVAPCFNKVSVKEANIGNWDEIIQVHEDTPCGEVIDILVNRKISCIPLVDNDGFISGIITKQDIMNAVADYKSQPVFTDVLKIPASKMVGETCLDFLVTAECTVEGAMKTLYDSWLPCLVVVDNQGEKVIAIISYADIMDFLFKAIDNPQMFKPVNSNGSIRSRINSIAS